MGDLRLSALDVGYDLRAQNFVAIVPPDCTSVGLDIDDETWLIEGTRSEIIDAMLDAGYRVDADKN